MSDYTKLKVAELKELLKSRDIPLTGLGKKQQFIDALEAHDGEDDENVDPSNKTAGNGNSKKREASASPADEPQTKQQKKTPSIAEAQVAKSSTVRVPLDDHCTLPSYHVYVDPADGLIFDASLNQTNASGNNNKFYRVQLLASQNNNRFHTWTRWGRVGESGANTVLGDGSLEDALKQFNKKFKDKSGLKWEDRGSDPKPGKYVFVERSYESDDEDEASQGAGDAVDKTEHKPAAQCTLEPAVESLMQLIFNQDYFDASMNNFNYDANKLPLGKLSKATISRGFQALKDLSALLDDASLATNYQLPAQGATEHLSNLFYSLIPHSFGRDRPPIISSQQMLKREVELLESLSDLKDAHNIIKSEKDNHDIHPLDSHFNALGLQEMTPLSPDSTEFDEIHQYLLKTCGQTHHISYKIQDIFRIERQGEIDRFGESEYSKVTSDRRLLWHGSRCSNFGGILSQGLRIAPPEAPVNGYMFGKGIYLADMSSKSANYCCPYISGGEALLLLCEAELGTPMQILTNADYEAAESAKEQGMYSTWGQGMTGPSKWKDAKVVHNSLADVKIPDTSTLPGDTGIPNAYLRYNEYICYDIAQVRLRYLLRVKM